MRRFGRLGSSHLTRLKRISTQRRKDAKKNLIATLRLCAFALKLSQPATFRSGVLFAIHSGEQNVANPELRFIARSAGIQVPHLSQRTNLFREGTFLSPGGALSEFATC